MDLRVDMYLGRAEDKIILAKANFSLSTNPEVKLLLNVPGDKTFFNDVISDAYYSVFYAAKAYLLSKSIVTEPPEEHKKRMGNLKKLPIPEN